MNYNICKKKCNQCYLKSIKNYSEEELPSIISSWWVLIKKQDNIFSNYYEIPIKKPLQKLLNKLSNDELKKEYYFYDKVHEIRYTNMDDLLRNIEMEKNDICPYYMEHFLSDIEHKSKKKEFMKKQKMRKNLQFSK